VAGEEAAGNMKQIKVIIVPNSKTNEIVGRVGDRVKIKIAAPPIGGQANKELIRFLAKHFHLRKHQITITEGVKSRLKTIVIEDPEES
jgi:uncharacterized protein (TIGR00251 family)